MPRQNSHDFVLLPFEVEPGSATHIPEHLAQTDWITHESRAADSAIQDVVEVLKKLDKKVSEDNVHRTRVVLRRWFSIWKVLAEDGWQSNVCKKDLIRPLKQLQKTLGALRDIDVNIEQGKRLGCSDDLLEHWRAQRKKQQVKLEGFVATHDVRRVAKKLQKYLSKRAFKLANRLPRAKAQQSAFAHLEFYLLAQESLTREMAQSARTPDELHTMRLAIKRWRYLLTEFFGVTNLELVRAQQILGQMHDLDRLTPLLLNEDAEMQALMHLKERRAELLGQIEEMRVRLPYGLRPHVSSSSFGSSAENLSQPT